MSHCNKKMLSFFLTTKCNLCCRYCYNAEERAKLREKSLPIHIAKAAVDWCFSSTPYRHIRFYGPGEPTMEFDLMREITEYARRKDKNVTVELQTNGVFNEEIRSWLLLNANIIWMSFDGMREIQDYYRPLNPKYYDGRTSGQILEENVRWLSGNSENRNLMVGARATITNDNIDRQIEMVDYFKSLGIKFIWSDPLFSEVGEKPAGNHQTIDLLHYVDEYVKAREYAQKKGIFYGSFLAVNFDGESDYHCRACTPLSAPHITPDGYISACDMVVIGSKPYHMDPFVIGQYDEDTGCFNIDEEKTRALEERKASNLVHCQDCPVKLHCGGYCLGETVNETGHLNGQNKMKCEAIKKLFELIGSCEPYKYLHP